MIAGRLPGSGLFGNWRHRDAPLGDVHPHGRRYFLTIILPRERDGLAARVRIASSIPVASRQMGDYDDFPRHALDGYGLSWRTSPELHRLGVGTAAHYISRKEILADRD